MTSTTLRRAAIVGGNRIPFARSNGAYARASNSDMLTATLDGLVARFGLQGQTVGEVVAGAVLKHSRDFNLTREAVLGSRLSAATPAYDVQQACGTGLEAAVLVANKIALGQVESGIAGGVDTTSDAPLAVNEDLRRVLLQLSSARTVQQRIKALGGLRPGQLAPELPRNLEPRTGLSMGEHAALTAREWGISREAQDELALASHQHLAAAYDAGFFDDLLTPYLGLTRDANLRADASLERLAGLKPVFGEGPDATMTAGNSTPLTDGASVVLLASDEWAAAQGLPVLAHLVDAQTAAVDYVHGGEGLLMAPAYALPVLLARQGLGLQDFDLYEIHEAFASTVLSTMRAWEDPAFCADKLGLDAPLGPIDRSKLNVHGSSLAAGHPFAATGGRIVATLAKALHQLGPGKRGLDLDLRGRRPGRRGDPGVLTHHPQPDFFGFEYPDFFGLKSCEETHVSDWYRDFANSGVGTTITKQLGLPRPAVLRRYTPGDPLVPGPVLVGSAGSGRLRAELAELLTAAGVSVQPSEEDRLSAVVLDATGLSAPAELAAVRDVLAPAAKRLLPSGRVLVLGDPPADADSPAQAATRQALDGLVRSIGKELRAGATANLLLVPAGAETSIAGPVRFFLSGRSAYVDGQVVALSPAELPADGAVDAPLAGKVAVVTGAARGIGAAIARTLSRDGAHVVAVDVPAAGQGLAEVANEVGGTALALDITAPDAAARLVEHLRERHGGVDVVVHNAGITRDKLLVNMDAARWDSVIAVNLQAQLDLTDALLAADGLLRDGFRMVCVSSTSGIAGNRGQTNYAASKAGIIGMVRAYGPAVAARGGAINAVAPGFIVTEMTASMPLGTREVGSRINSLQQGGSPVDVAETIAWLSQPGSGGVNGQTVRVCGQSLLGA